MFSVGPNEFFQGFNNEVLHAISVLVNLINMDIFFFIALLIIMFAIDFKRGFLITHAFFWTTLIATVLNLIFDVPRPGDFQDIVFHGLSDGNMVQDGGFPSVLMAKTCIFWLSLWHFYKQKWLLLTSILLIVISSISFLYTGNQLLSDIIFGILLGLIMYGLIFRIIYNEERLNIYLKKCRHGFIRPGRALFRVVYFFIVPAFLLLIPGIEINYLAKLMGLNLAFYLVGIKRWPDNEASNYKRMLRIIIVFGVFIFLNLFTSLFIVPELSFKYFFTNLIEMYLTIHISVYICRQTGLFTG